MSGQWLKQRALNPDIEIVLRTRGYEVSRLLPKEDIGKLFGEE